MVNVNERGKDDPVPHPYIQAVNVQTSRYACVASCSYTTYTYYSVYTVAHGPLTTGAYILTKRNLAYGPVLRSAVTARTQHHGSVTAYLIFCCVRLSECHGNGRYILNQLEASSNGLYAL